MNRVKNWLETLGQNLGQDIHLDEDGMCNLQCEDDIMIIVEAREDSPVFFVSSPLTDIPGDRDNMLKMFGRALSLNLFTVETRGATIGFAEELGKLMLSLMQEKEGCDEQRFAAILKDFHETAAAIRNRLEKTVDIEVPQGSSRQMMDFV